jgi:hypothetical protein
MVDIGAVAGIVGGIAAGLEGAKPTTPEKLKITLCRLQNPNTLQETKTVSVPFNPTSYSISKTVNWSPSHTTAAEGAATERGSNAPGLQSGGGDSRILSMELFFDVTEDPNVIDVRNYTNQIAELAYIDPGTGQQPICKLFWGPAIGDKINNVDYPFIGVVTRLQQNFTLFRSSGEPVRARLTLEFREFILPEQEERRTDPELTTRVVKLGDTLSGIAAEYYNDPTLWRVIAEANRLDDPRSLKPGQSLSIPELQ